MTQKHKDTLPHNHTQPQTKPILRPQLVVVICTPWVPAVGSAGGRVEPSTSIHARLPEIQLDTSQGPGGTRCSQIQASDDVATLDWIGWRIGAGKTVGCAHVGCWGWRCQHASAPHGYGARLHRHGGTTAQRCSSGDGDSTHCAHRLLLGANWLGGIPRLKFP